MRRRSKSSRRWGRYRDAKATSLRWRRRVGRRIKLTLVSIILSLITIIVVSTAGAVIHTIFINLPDSPTDMDPGGLASAFLFLLFVLAGGFLVFFVVNWQKVPSKRSPRAADIRGLARSQSSSFDLDVREEVGDLRSVRTQSQIHPRRKRIKRASRRLFERLLIVTACAVCANFLGFLFFADVGPGVYERLVFSYVVVMLAWLYYLTRRLRNYRQKN